MKFILAFLLLPLVEIYLFIQIGGGIGAGWTVALILLTAVIGAALVSAQGVSTLRRARAQLAAGQAPTVEIIEGVMLLVVGAVLLVPGFFTDAIGFALLVPPLRRRLIRRVASAGNFGARFTMRANRPRGASRPRRIIDADYEKID